MKRFSLLSGGLALLVAVTTAGAVEPLVRQVSDTAVQPVSVSSLLGDETEKPEYYDSCYECEPLWNIYVGAVILKRESPSVATDFDFDWEPGVDVDVRRRLGRDYQLQVRYFGVDDWDDQQFVLVPGTPFVGDANYSSNLHSTEVNLRRDWTDRLNVLAGFRWVELGEEVGMIPPAPTARINTNNHLYGAQLGAEWIFWDRGGPFTANVGGKAGIYYNDMSSRGTVAIGSLRADDDDVAFLGELALTGIYQLNDNWSVRAGYQLVWIEGVATADLQADRFDLIGGTVDGIDTDGSPFYHGATVGVEFRY